MRSSKPLVKLLTLFSLVAILPEGSALAYPNAVIFAPSGEAKAQGDASILTYVAYFGESPLTWAGMNVGLLPSFGYGDSGLSFGGLEVGLDLISMAGMAPANKPVFNGKAQLLVETGFLPSLAVGVSGLAPSAPETGLNATYVAATKTLSWGERPLGRVTVGGGAALSGAQAGFHATAPFSDPSQALLLGGYESPAWGPANLAIDHIGGVSEIGATTLGLNLQVNPGTYLGIGYTMGNDRTLVPADAAYVYLFSALTLLDKTKGH